MRDATVSPPESKGLPLATQIGWGLGTLGPALIMSAFNILMLRFMTDHIGIAAATAGLLIALSKLYDAVTDPLTGVLSDRTTSGRGRRRPWLLWGGGAMAASFVLMFWVPTFESVAVATAYMLVMLLLYASAYSAYNIPYLAMPAEMTTRFDQRNYLMTFRVVSVALAGILAQYVGLRIIAASGGGREGHETMALALAPVVLASTLIAYLATRNAPFTVKAATQPRYPLTEQLRLIGRNRPFMLLLTVKFLTLMMLGVQAAFPFFFNQILRVPDNVLAAYFLTVQMTVFVSQPVWLALARLIGKRNCLMIALFIMVCIGLTWLLAGEGDPAWAMYARGLFLGFAQGGVLLMGQALLPDTMEYDFHLSGLRREGLFAAFYTTIEKTAQAVGVTVIGAFLGTMGYIAGGKGLADQPDSALLAIRLSVGLIPALLCGSAFIALLFYNLSEARLQELRRRLPAHPQA